MRYEDVVRDYGHTKERLKAYLSQRREPPAIAPPPKDQPVVMTTVTKTSGELSRRLSYPKSRITSFQPEKFKRQATTAPDKYCEQVKRQKVKCLFQRTQEFVSIATGDHVPVEHCTSEASSNKSREANEEDSEYRNLQEKQDLETDAQHETEVMSGRNKLHKRDPETKETKELHDVRKALDEARATRDDYTEEYNRANNRIEDMQSKLDHHLETQANENKARLLPLESQLAAVQTRCSSAESKNKDLMKDLTTERIRYTQLEDQLAQSRIEIDGLQQSQAKETRDRKDADLNNEKFMRKVNELKLWRSDAETKPLNASKLFAYCESLREVQHRGIADADRDVLRKNFEDKFGMLKGEGDNN
ncbi:hypothetical protein BDV96DRAFT_641015 [Lophiotrema nucula]|uniref:Uncharacterized protein n=1 Tax=Lophiotrema nucula TaxID=690887 RepID=A0A6A5ZQ84_9PLEO|nr:hypothetical protein BDV96DRAFT_641015 [Lophiotrema nucula]